MFVPVKAGGNRVLPLGLDSRGAAFGGGARLGLGFAAVPAILIPSLPRWPC